MDLTILPKNKPKQSSFHSIIHPNMHSLHISIETSVQIQFEHNLYVHDLSIYLVDNELVQELIATSVQDQRQHSRMKFSLCN